MDQLLEAFHNLANGDRLITETNMRQAHLSLDVTNFLKHTMQTVQQDEQGQSGYDCKLAPCYPRLKFAMELMCNGTYLL